MDKLLVQYLESVDKHLKPLPAAERQDIVKEIESQLLELEASGMGSQQILTRMGNPKSLAKGYLGDLIAQTPQFSWKKALALYAYYLAAGFSGLIVIPVLGICCPVFLLCGIAVPLAGIVKVIDGVVFPIPFADGIMVFGVENPFLIFLVCLAAGALLLLMGAGCWWCLLAYFRGLQRVQRILPK